MRDGNAEGKTKPSDSSKNREGSGTRKFKIAQSLAHPAPANTFVVTM